MEELQFDCNRYSNRISGIASSWIVSNEVARDKLVKRLQEKMDEHNGYLTTGFAGTGDLPHALLDSGLRRRSYKYLPKETPS